jgi:hypothetical protein
MVVVAAIGKTSAFVIALAFWTTGELPGRTVVAAAGDLTFAGIFVWWLLGDA